MMLSDRITIIILTFKSEGIIDSCLQNIMEYKNVTVVDNASNDNIKTHIETKYPNVKFIGLDKNIGFGRANNVVLNQVDTDYALVLNPDAGIKPEAIEHIIKVMDALPNAALGSPVIINHKIKKLKYKILRKFFSSYDFTSEENYKLKKIDALARRSKKHIQANKGYEGAMSTDFICGCGMFFKMSLMKQVGFFDENIFMYHEDSIISKNVINHGYENVIVKDAVLHHMCNASSTTDDKPLNERLEYFKNWQLGWSQFYLLSEAHYKSNKIIADFYKKKQLWQLKYQLLRRKFLGKDSTAIQANIDGCMAYDSGANPFAKTI